jgi:hypothetical protein
MANDEGDDDFGQDWEDLCGAQKYDFHYYVSVDRNVATSGVSTVELCEAYGSTRSVEEKNKEDENEEDMVPNFAETYEAYEKVRAYFYAHSVSDADSERILGLEKSYFLIEAKFCHEAKCNVRLFSIKKWFFGFFVFEHLSFVFSAPFKNEKSKVHCIFKTCCIMSYFAQDGVYFEIL